MELDAHDTPVKSAGNSNGTKKNSPSPSFFDFETYVSRYEPRSETRLQRLLFIASQTTNDEVARMCYDMAEAQLKVMGNTKVYRDVFGRTINMQQSPDYQSSEEAAKNGERDKNTS